MNAAWTVGVVVPARNEEQTIARCIASVRQAVAARSRIGQVWMVVVADSCTDSTVEIARRELGDFGEVIECSARSPGTARRLGVAAVMNHFCAIDPARIWLANTDADSYVPRDWLEIHLAQAGEGAGAVAGIVRLDEDGLCAQVRDLYLDTYELHADGTHPHVHGANLGVRGDAYLDVGGWSHLTVSEDHCLWGRLRTRGWLSLSLAASIVTTSGRLHGRAMGGFADTLRREAGKRG